MKYLIFFIVLIFINCTNKFINLNLEKNGYYSDKPEICFFVKNKKQIVFIPISHFGTKNLYENIKLKTDSLLKNNFVFFLEGVKSSKNIDSTFILKKRKFFGLYIGENSKTYLNQLKFQYKNLNFKKELIDQPKYDYFGLNNENSYNIDCTFNDILNEFEKSYGEIKLTECDYKTPILDTYNCKNSYNEKLKNSIIIDYRNQILFNELNNSKFDKIAIIYGKAHLNGIKDSLLKLGFKIYTNK